MVSSAMKSYAHKVERRDEFLKALYCIHIYIYIWYIYIYMVLPCQVVYGQTCLHLSVESEEKLRRRIMSAFIFFI